MPIARADEPSAAVVLTPVAAPLRSADDYRAVFLEHRSRLVRFAYLLGTDPALVDDVVADVFVRTFAPWRAGAVADVGAYLRRSVVNGVRDRARRRRTHDRWVATVPAALARADGGDQPAADGRVAERARVVQALATLPDDQRVVVVLRYYDDLSEAATAAVLGIPVGTVKSRTARALERLHLAATLRSAEK